MAIIISILYKYFLISFFICVVGFFLWVTEEITVGQWIGYTVVWPAVLVVFIYKSVQEVLK